MIIADAPFLTQDFWHYIANSIIVSVVAMIVLTVYLRVIDKMTPGDMNKELLGTETVDGLQKKSPNVALAIVVAALILGLCIIVSSVFIRM